MWDYLGQRRPPFALEPGPGQESVWDYPRPPRLEPSDKRVFVRNDSAVIADTQNALRLLETGSPPTYYLPIVDVDFEALEPVAARSFCEWKGAASYWCLKGGKDGKSVAWRYLLPSKPYEVLKDYAAFYSDQLDCSVDGERVQAQPGAFYGGWVTGDIVGPWKGEPGTSHW